MVWLWLGCGYVALGLAVARYITLPWMRESYPITWADGEGRGLLGFSVVVWPIFLTVGIWVILGKWMAGDE